MNSLKITYITINYQNSTKVRTFLNENNFLGDPTIKY